MSLFDIIALSLCFICLALASISHLIAKWFKLGDEGLEEEDEYIYEQYKKPTDKE